MKRAGTEGPVHAQADNILCLIVGASTQAADGSGWHTDSALRDSTLPPDQNKQVADFFLVGSPSPSPLLEYSHHRRLEQNFVQWEVTCILWENKGHCRYCLPRSVLFWRFSSSSSLFLCLLFICNIPTSANWIPCVHKVYCAYTPSNGAMTFFHILSFSLPLSVCLPLSACLYPYLSVCHVWSILSTEFVYHYHTYILLNVRRC